MQLKMLAAAARTVYKRKLAYEINYISEGYYVLMKFTSGADFPAELDRILGITDGIMRRLITLRAE